MFSYIMLSLVVLLSPLSINWDTIHSTPIKIESFKYHLGDTKWGLVVYTGEDLGEMETELQLTYSSNRLASALLILGPIGLNEDNCLIKYKNVIKMLNEKYGHFTYQKETRDPLSDDLVVKEYCNSTKLGLHEVDTVWKKERFKIEALMIGDNDGLYIHITYSDTKLSHKFKKQQREKILKRL